MSDRYFMPDAMPRRMPTSWITVKRPSFFCRREKRKGAFYLISVKQEDILLLTFNRKYIPVTVMNRPIKTGRKL